MIKGILSIAGKPGLYKLVNPGKNMLIVESLQTGKRTPAYARDKVISLADISMYTVDEDMPLADVLEAVKAKTQGQPIDVKALGSDANIRAYFAEILPSWDPDRIYTNDIKKLFSWYNQLLAAGIDTFKDSENETTQEQESEEKTAE